MAGIISAERFRFLFRQDRGTIDRLTWAFATTAILLVWLVFWLVEVAVNRTGDITRVGVTGIFVMATMLLAACFYFVSAKRFRERKRPPALAVILPAVGLADAALRVMQPAAGGTFPLWFATAADVVLIGVVIWNIVELGFMAGWAPERPGRDA